MEEKNKLPILASNFKLLCVYKFFPLGRPAKGFGIGLHPFILKIYPFKMKGFSVLVFTGF